MLRSAENREYANDREYVFALASEMRHEYKCILDRGHILQLDAPDLAMERTLMFQHQELSEFLERVEMHVEALNTAIEGLPSDQSVFMSAGATGMAHTSTTSRSPQFCLWSTRQTSAPSACRSAGIVINTTTRR